MDWEGAKTLLIDHDVTVHFLPITISYHMTNYKPTFMLQLFNGLCKEMEQIAYFDPDIVLRCNWKFFQTWMSNGVALVHEIVNNDMPPSHPIRKEWAKVAILCNRTEPRELYSYINAGFFGVSREFIEFVELFKEVIQVAKANFHMEDSVFQLTTDRSDLFYAKDQDALNIAAMYSHSPISEMGPEAMDFSNSGFTMAHAVGSPKPWAKDFISSALRGVPPSMAEKAFWANVTGPITIYSSSKIKWMMTSLKIAGLIGRFYRRG